MVSEKESKFQAKRIATLSLRTLLLAVAVVAAYLGVFISASRADDPYTAVGVVSCLVVLLALVCSTFASFADDLWRDPDSTFVAALFGFIGYAIIVALGTLMPVAGWFVDSGSMP